MVRDFRWLMAALGGWRRWTDGGVGTRACAARGIVAYVRERVKNPDPALTEGCLIFPAASSTMPFPADTAAAPTHRPAWRAGHRDQGAQTWTRLTNRTS